MASDLRLDPETAETLITAVQDLSLAKDLATVMAVVRCAARKLTGADGATFVLKEGTFCFYADEDAIAPLWKGNRFPLEACVSGWVMTHREPVVIPDIFRDPRVPVEAYRPTFVKSLAMVPIRPSAPIAAIGNYWSHHHHASDLELSLLQSLANSTCVAMENIELYADLERRVKVRTLELAASNRELEETNRELEAFAYSASHDLRAPLRTIQGFARFLAEDRESRLSPDGAKYLNRIERASERMDALIRDLLSLARFSMAAVNKQTIDLSAMVQDVLQAVRGDSDERQVDIRIRPNATAWCDPGLIRIVLENLLSNAWKFTSQRPDATIEFDFADHLGQRDFFVRDNGAGFDPAYAAKLFVPFQRLHVASEFPGVGIGLATVRRIVAKHGGSVGAEGKPGRGATFSFRLPVAAEMDLGRVPTGRLRSESRVA